MHFWKTSICSYLNTKLVHNKEAMLETLLVKCYGYMWRKGLTVTRLYFRIQYSHSKDVK